MRVVVRNSRAIAMGLVFAAAGFCLAVNTSSPEAPAGVGERAVGTSIPLRFTNPLLAFTTNEYDLGDACFGSIITRYVTAEGGIRPYRFTSFGTNSFSNVIEGFQTNLQFGLSGVLAGSCPPVPLGAFGLPNPAAFPSKTLTGAPGFRFFVQVQDARGTNAAAAGGNFNLFLVDIRNSFKFAMDKIPSARLGASYLTKVDVLGGNGAINFSLLSASNLSTGAATTAKDLGIFVSRDGTILGQPLAVGTFALTVRCVDGASHIATSRDASQQDQVFILSVADNPITSSDVTTLQCSVRGDLSGGARDSLRYKAIANVLGQDGFQLENSEFSFHLGSLGFSGRLDRKGNFTAVLRDHSKVSAKVNASKGSVDVTISGGTFTALLGFDKSPPTAANTRLPVQISIGDAVANSEVLDFETSLSGSRYGLNYRLGSSGSSAAGGFQIVSVNGKDKSTFSGQLGDSWRAAFLALPRTAVVDPSGLKQGFDNVNNVTVRIGSNFTQSLNSGRLRSSNAGLSFGGTIADGVKQFSYSTRSLKGKLTTNVIASTSTGIIPAIQSPKVGNIFFPLGVDFARAGGAPFSGEHARRIFGLKNNYRDVPPKR